MSGHLEIYSCDKTDIHKLEKIINKALSKSKISYCITVFTPVNYKRGKK